METSGEAKPHVRFEFEVERIVGMSNDGTYQVQWAPSWVSRFHLVGCEHLIQEFQQRHVQTDIKTEPDDHYDQSDNQTTEAEGNICDKTNGISNDLITVQSSSSKNDLVDSSIALTDSGVVENQSLTDAGEENCAKFMSLVEGLINTPLVEKGNCQLPSNNLALLSASTDGLLNDLVEQPTASAKTSSISGNEISKRSEIDGNDFSIQDFCVNPCESEGNQESETQYNENPEMEEDPVEKSHEKTQNKLRNRTVSPTAHINADGIEKIATWKMAECTVVLEPLSPSINFHRINFGRTSNSNECSYGQQALDTGVEIAPRDGKGKLDRERKAPDEKHFDKEGVKQHNTTTPKYVSVKHHKRVVPNKRQKYHLRFHSREKMLKCSHCDKNFNSYDDLVRHICIRTPQPLACSYCNELFVKKLDLDRHVCAVVKDPKSGKNSLTCNQFSNRFMASNVKRPVLIEMCNKLHTCNTCGKSFARSKELLRHQHTHSEDNSYICSYCNLKFSNSSSLEQHLYTHTCDKTYSCSASGRPHTRKCPLTRHTQLHSGMKACTCDTCKKTFSKKEMLERHLQTHAVCHKNTCNQCGKQFSTKWNLKVHSRVHTGEKPYLCDVCGRSFVRSHNLIKHERVHTG